MNTRVLCLITIASFFWEPTSQAQVSFERILDANNGSGGRRNHVHGAGSK